MRRLRTPLAALALLWGAASSAGATCLTTRNVAPGGLQTALNALSTTTVAGGDYCIVLGSGYYAESLAISSVSFGDAASRVVLVSSQPLGSAVIVGLSTAAPAFKIGSASVTVQGIAITTGAAGGFPVGISISSPNVTLSSVTVSDPAGLIATAGVSVTADQATIADSSITATGGSASALSATNARFLTVQRSTFTGNLDPGGVLTSVSSSTISNSYFGSNGGAGGLRLLSSPYNTISQSTFSYSGSNRALEVNGSSYVVVTNCFINNPAGPALLLTSGVHNDQVLQSTITANTSISPAASVDTNATFNTLDQDYIYNAAGNGLYFSFASSNTVSRSTMTSAASGASYGAVAIVNSNTTANTITSSVITGTAGNGLLIDSFASQNTISLDAISSQGSAAGTAAVLAHNSSTNTITQCAISAANTDALFLSGASSTTIDRSTMTVSLAAKAGAHFLSSFSNALTNSYASSLFGDGVFLDAGSNGNLLSGTTMYNNVNATYAALRLVQASSNTISAAFIRVTTGSGLQIGASSTYNTISQSTMAISGNNGAPVSISGGSANNTLTQSYVENLFTGSVGIWATATADNLTVSQSTIVANGAGSFGVYFDVSHSTVTQSVVSAAGGVGVEFNFNSLGSVLRLSQISASTGVLVSGSTGAVLDSDLVTASGSSAFATQSGAGLTFLSASTFTATGAFPRVGVSLAGAGPVQAKGTLVVRGDFNILSGSFDAGNWWHAFGGDLNWGGAQGLALGGSTITLDGVNDTPPLSFQKVVSPAAAPAFGVLVVNTSSVAFTANGFTAQSLTDAVAGSTLAFQAAAPSAFSLQRLTALGGAGAQRLSIESTAAGSAWSGAIGVSSISYASVRDSSASAVVQANDGTSIDLGGNTNWNFLPLLVVVPPGQTWTDGVGLSGTPAATAGSAAVTVRAVSASSATVPVAIPVTLTSDDANEPAIPAANTSAGVASFSLQARTARTDILQASSTMAFSGGASSASLTVSPAPFTKLRLLLPGQSAAPGTAGGASGSPTPSVVNTAFSVTVQSVDQYNNLVTTGADQVSISTASGVNLPQTQTLLAGVTTFPNVVFTASGTARSITASDVTNPGITAQTSPAFGVLAPSASSPTATIGIALNSVQTTLGGALSGTASDASGVTQVRVALEKLSTSQFFSWSAQTFSAPSAAYATAALSSPNGTSTSWSVAMADALLTNDTYYAVAIASNVGGAYTLAETTFVFQSNGLAAGSAGDGQGSAVALAAAGGVSCQVQVATITFTAGAAGIQTSGAIALHVPDNWQQPTGEDAASNPPANPGYLHVVSATPYGLSFNPTSYGGLPLGTNWVVFRPSATVTAGQPIQFVYKGFPGVGPAAIGAQAFSILTQGSSNGNLKPIASQPSFSLAPGPASQLVFNPNLPLTVGPLQTSPTMQLLVTDGCGNSTATATSVTIALSAGQYNAPDPTAVFYSSNGTLLGGSGASLPLPGNNAGTPGFYFVTSAASGFENVIATAAITASAAFAGRYVNVLASSVSLANVSIDTGTLAPGVQTATMTGTAFQGQAFVNFTLSDPKLNWELIVSTSPSDFYPEVVHRFGVGNPGRTLTWNGIDERVYPQRYLPSGGPYYIKIRVAGGVIEDNSLSAYIAQAASVYGTVNSTGAFAYVQAYGPNANYANFAVASSTGFFQIFGLQNGVQYNVVATTGIVKSGQLLRLNSSANGVTATNAGANVGAIPFPTSSLLRVNVQIPNASPAEFWGGLNVHTADYSRTTFGTLHYLQGADHSDDGSVSFGSAASTWTVLGVLPGTYNVDINLPQVGISSTVQNVVIGPGTNDLAVSLPRKANVYGWAVLPSTTDFGTWVSVQALKAGDTRPSIFGGAFVPGNQQTVNQTSATYALYGLDPGSWTITARAFGFGSVSSNVYVSSTADIGNATTGGFDLFVSSGGVLRGVVNLIGDSTQLPSLNNSQSGVTLWVNAYNPQTYSSGGTQVVLSTSATLSSSTFSITGLDNGSYFVNSWLSGAAPIQMTTSVVNGAGNATLNVLVNSARAAITFQLPGPATTEMHKVALFQAGQGGPQVAQDLAAGPGSIQYFGSSATWTSPALGAGYYAFTAFYNKTGMYKTISVPLTNNATQAAFVDLSGSTFSVSGSVLLSANVNFSPAAGTVVSVSSVAGVLANSANAQYCLLGSATAVSTPAFHMELLPVSPFGGGFLSGNLIRGASCASPSIPNNVDGDSPNPLLAYVANVSTDGSFAFPSVPPGTYLLRVPTSIDLSGNDQLPAVRQVLTVSSNTAGVSFSIGSGVTISGNVLLPPGLTATRPIGLILLDSSGNTVKQTFVDINNANSAPYSFTHVPNGGFAIRLQDFGFPQIYGARTLTFKAAGVDLPGQDIQLIRTGIIKGKFAVQQTLAGSTTQQYLLITQNNANLLPKKLKVYAEATPWFQGGHAKAFNLNCGGADATAGGGDCDGFTLDADDHFVIMNVLPGIYDVHYQSHDDPTDNASLKIVSTLTPGVVVGEARTTDIGTVNLPSATQIRGTVYDVVTSSPIANVVMAAEPSISGNKHDTPQATTDANGRFTLVGLDPAVKLYDIYANFRNGGGAAIPNYALKVSPAVDVTTTSVVDFALTPAPYSVAGRVVGVPGGPALQQSFNTGNGDVSTPGAVVFLQKTTELPHDNPIADTIVATDANGSFSITALTTGTYKMVVASLNYSSLSQLVTISSGSVNLGTINLGVGGSLSGAIRKPDGSYPSPRDVDFIGAVTADFSQLLVATRVEDHNTNTITGYSISGFKPGVSYQLIIGDDGNAFSTPDEARRIVFSTTTESRTLDVVLRPSRPIIIAKARHSGTGYLVSFELSKPLREKTRSDDNLTAVLSTFSALGTLSQLSLAPGRSLLTAFYSPAVNESSFTLKFSGYSTLSNPDSIDPVNPEFMYLSTFTFFSGVDGYLQNNVSNLAGGTLVVEGNNGRVAIPGGAFSVDASSTVQVTLQLSQETLSGAATSGLRGSAANIASLRMNGGAYPQGLLKALAAAPSGVNPLSSFYDILLPLGVRTALQKPVQMTVSYSTGTDPAALNLYWYNAAANAYVLQQDVTGAKPVIDAVNHTITINVNHFSTFVLFNSNVAVITGQLFSGGAMEAYNFPNPFDLTPKTVSTVHGGGTPSVRGTMIRFSLPSDVSGDASIRIFNVAGERVRTIGLGTLNGGNYFYQEWDGRNDAGRDVASGVYIGQVKVGSKSKFFKMALIK